jgi:hypothetical protein
MRVGLPSIPPQSRCARRNSKQSTCSDIRSTRLPPPPVPSLFCRRHTTASPLDPFETHSPDLYPNPPFCIAMVGDDVAR